MSALEELAVVLEHDIDEQYQYQPGELLRGTVRIRATRLSAVHTVAIHVVGQGNVSWKDAAVNSIHQAEETYIDVSQNIVDAKSIGQHLNLNPGFHEFRFEYQLPENLPSSFIGKFGNVTYTIKASITGVKPADTAITSEPFLVLRRSPLPPSIEEPLVLQQEKRVWGGCMFGKVSAKLTMERRGGVPAEDLFMHAEIKNRCHRTVTAMQAALVMVSTYHAQNQKTSFRQVVSRKRDEYDVEHNEGRRWSFVRLNLPPYIPETHLDHCDIIDIEYFVQFRVEISGGAELKIEAPILIGGHPHGLEFQPEQPSNHHWTIRAKGFQMDPSDMAENDIFSDDLHNNWGRVSGVPELRGDKVVISNPLFRHGSFMAKGMVNVNNIPDEFMENTRL